MSLPQLKEYFNRSEKNSLTLEIIGKTFKKSLGRAKRIPYEKKQLVMVNLQTGWVIKI